MAGEATSGLMGPDYDYSAQIRAPSGPGGLGMSPNGTIGALESDIKGLMNYVKVLVSGDGASKTGKPLGTKFFLSTPLQCTDKTNNSEVQRSIYINNVPDGSIGLSIPNGGMSMQFPAFKGLLPGVMSNLAQINPLKILASFTNGDNPYCQQITMETIDANNVRGQAQAYVTDTDINIMPKNWFTIPGNPKPNTMPPPAAPAPAAPPAAGGKQPFTTMSALQPADIISNGQMPNDVLIRIYFALLGLLGFYFFLKLMLRSRLR